MLIDKIALILMIIGGLNWGLIGIFKLDLVALLCGGQTGAISRIVYTLVGLAAQRLSNRCVAKANSLSQYRRKERYR